MREHLGRGELLLGAAVGLGDRLELGLHVGFLDGQALLLGDRLDQEEHPDPALGVLLGLVLGLLEAALDLVLADALLLEALRERVERRLLLLLDEIFTTKRLSGYRLGFLTNMSETTIEFAKSQTEYMRDKVMNDFTQSKTTRFDWQIANFSSCARAAFDARRRGRTLRFLSSRPPRWPPPRWPRPR